MSSPIVVTQEISEITPGQKFEGHTDVIRGVIHLPGQRMMTCSRDDSLRVWNLKSGKQIGDDWRDGDSGVWAIALSPDGKKVVSSGGFDCAVRLWDIDTGNVIAKWTGHMRPVWSVCWSRDGRRVVSASIDGIARQWDVKKGKTILAPIKTGHHEVWAVVCSPDRAMFATSGWDEPYIWASAPQDCSIKIWNAKTGKLVVTLKGHRDCVRRLAWTPNGKILISGSEDHSIRTWSTKTWTQLAVLDEHTDKVWSIAISPNSRILASASKDNTARLWNLDDGQSIGSPLQHADLVACVSFSVDGKELATGCKDHNMYTWDVAAIVREAGLDDLLSDPKADKPALHTNVTRRPVQQRPLAYQVPQGFFDGVPSGCSIIVLLVSCVLLYSYYI